MRVRCYWLGSKLVLAISSFNPIFRDHFANSFCVQVASMPEMHFSLLGFAHFLWAMNVGKRFVVCRVWLDFLFNFKWFTREPGRQIVFNMLQIKLKQVCGWPKVKKKITQRGCVNWKKNVYVEINPFFVVNEKSCFSWRRFKGIFISNFAWLTQKQALKF